MLRARLRAAIRQTLFCQNVSRENLSNFNDAKLSQYTVYYYGAYNNYIAIFHLIHNHLIIAIVVIKNNSLISRHSLLCSGYITGQGITPRGCIQLTYIKSIDMLSKNTPGVKKSEAKSEVPCS